MLKFARLLCVGLLSMGTGVYAGQTSAPATRATGSERFEIFSIKAVRPTLVNTIAALKKGDIAGAKAASAVCEIGWSQAEPADASGSR